MFFCCWLTAKNFTQRKTGIGQQHRLWGLGSDAGKLGVTSMACAAGHYSAENRP